MKEEILIEAIIASSRGISDDLYRGNDKSKRMGRILSICIDVMEKSDARFERMWGDLTDVYSEMRDVHNKIYQQLGGVLGSGSFFPVEVEEADRITDIGLKKVYEGLDAEGFNKLQTSIHAIRSLRSDLVDMSPIPTKNSPKFDMIDRIYWLTLMSVYESKHRDKVIKIINKYDPKSS